MRRLAFMDHSMIDSAKLVLFTAVLVFQQCATVNAQFVTGGAFATRGYRGQTPLSVNYSMEIPPSMSMGVVKVNITDTTGPSKTDRDLTVILYTKCWGQGANATAYRYHLGLAEGQTNSQIEIPFTASESQLAWDVSVYEQGRDIEDKRKRNTVNNTQVDYHWTYNGNQPGNDFSVCGLLSTQTDPKSESRNLKVIADFVDSKVQAQLAAQRLALPQGTVLSPTSMIPVDKASTDWRHYYPYAVWIASNDALAEIHNQRPQVAAALRTYVSAGGILLVYGVPSSESVLNVNQLLSGSDGNAELTSWRPMNQFSPAWWVIGADSEAGMQPIENRSDSRTIAQANATGAAYDAALLTDTLLETGLGGHRDNVNSLMDVLGFEDLSIQQITAGRQRLMAALGNDRIMVRQYARGKVVVCSKPLHELLNSQIAAIVALKDEHALCTLTAQSHDGNWFWKNLIIEVGKPPVWAFCVMVTLFGALLGPGLLFFTGRIQRRSLMIFLVPVLSLVATLAIVTYGVFHEGFATNVRIHSVTAYDGPARVAFAWSRQNYFSGAVPREGLQFPVDAYVRSVFSDDGERYSGTPDPRRNITATVSVGEYQTWIDWLKPRQHQQLLVGHSVDPRTIPISTQRTEKGQLLLKNLTGVKLPMVAVRGGQDDYYFEADLGPHETRETKSQDLDSVAVAVGRIGADYKPKIPPELEGGSDSLLNFGNVRRYARSYQSQVPEIISESFRRYLSDELELEPHGFATLVPEFDGIVVPLKGVQSDNVNLVIGVDPW